MRIDRSLLNWGVFLVTLGGVPLAVQRGWADAGIAGEMWRLWPLILVGIGLGLILRWTPVAWLGGAIVAATVGLVFGALLASSTSACGGIGSGQTVTASESGASSGSGFALEATVCGDMKVSRGTGAEWSVEARHQPDYPPFIESSESGLILSEAVEDSLFVLSQQTRSDWVVGLPAAAALSVDMTLGGEDGSVDLGDGPVERVNGTFNGGSIVMDLGSATTPQPADLSMTLTFASGTLKLPAGSMAGHLTLNVSSLELCLPAAAEARFELEPTLSSDNFASSGLTKVDDSWQTAGFDTAPNRIDLSITSTVSSVSIERPEVCP